MSKKLQSGRTINCPAGEAARLGCGVFCKIENKVIMESGPSGGDIDRTSIRVFCTGDSSKGNEGFPVCPTWQSAQESGMTQHQASHAAHRASDKGVDLDNEILEEHGAL